jgi:branched-subunit amino acid aminotransferase/4-amino-4-deoxychorismate lyase
MSMNPASPSYWLCAEDGFRPVDSVPLTDRGFRYGMAVFETLRVRAGKPLFLEAHLASLHEACRRASFPDLDEEFDQARHFLTRGFGGAANGVARIHVTAGDGAPGEPVTQSRVFIGFETRLEPADEVYRQGWRLTISDNAYHPALGGRKTHNYWSNVEALTRARLRGCDEALLFDAYDRLVSGCMGNVFIVSEEGRLLTPGHEVGARKGIIRAWVMARREVSDNLILPDTLHRAREVFLTNSWIGIMPAASLGRRLMFAERAVSTALREELQTFYDQAARQG